MSPRLFSPMGLMLVTLERVEEAEAANEGGAIAIAALGLEQYLTPILFDQPLPWSGAIAIGAVLIAAVIIGGTSFAGGKGSVIGTFFGVCLLQVLGKGRKERMGMLGGPAREALVEMVQYKNEKVLGSANRA